MATIVAVKMGGFLKDANLGSLPLLVGFIAVVGIVGVIIVGAIPKWAIFALIFVPLFMKLDVSPEVVLAAYRVADSPVNVVTPLMPYFAMIVAFTQKYQKEAGVGTVVAMMLPYYVVVFVVWTLLLVGWYLLGFRLGRGERSYGVSKSVPIEKCYRKQLDSHIADIKSIGREHPGAITAAFPTRV